MRDTDAKQFLHATFARVMDDHDITKALFLLKQILTGGDTAQEAVAAERRLGYIGEPAVQTAMHMILDDHFSQYDRDQLPVIGNTVSLRLYQLIGERIHLQQYVEPINYTRHDVWVSAAVCRDKEEESVLTSIWAVQVESWFAATTSWPYTSLSRRTLSCWSTKTSSAMQTSSSSLKKSPISENGYCHLFAACLIK